MARKPDSNAEAVDLLAAAAVADADRNPPAWAPEVADSFLLKWVGAVRWEPAGK